MYLLERTAGSSKRGCKRFQVCLNFSKADVFESLPQFTYSIIRLVGYIM